MFNKRYRILSNLGQGGFGDTFIAEDTNMPSRRRCVIKRLKPNFTSDRAYEVAKQRFAREAAILETLGDNHPQIPRLYGYFEEEHQFYLVQELIQGQPWDIILKERNEIPETEIKILLSDLLPVLDYIHSQGIIHRDIKLSNIIRRAEDGKPVLIDFGAVKEQLNNSQLYSLAIGTPGFMSPEQIGGQPTPASDLYSLGMCAVTLLTGIYPNLLEQDEEGKYLWSSEGIQVSPEFRKFLDRSIHPDLTQRFRSAEQMLAALKPLIDDSPTQQQTTKKMDLSLASWTRRIQGFLPQHPWGIIGEISGAITVIIIGMNLFGWINPYKALSFDRLLRQRRPYETPDPRLLIIEATAEDIATQPLSEETLAQVLEKLQQYEPSVIVLDINPKLFIQSDVPDFTQYLEQDNILSICQGINSNFINSRISDDQIGYRKMIKDTDGVVRRHSLSQPSPNLKDSCVATSEISFQAAIHYLNQQGFELKTHSADQTLVLHNTQSGKNLNLPISQSSIVGYQQINPEERQILLNYRILPSPDQIANRITFSDLLNNPISPQTQDTLKNRIIFVGVVDPAYVGDDYWRTPYSPILEQKQKETVGLYLRAQMTSQILSAALDNRPLLWSFSWWLEWLWILFWSLGTTFLVWRCRTPRQRVFVSLIILGSFYGTCYLFILQGGWLPLPQCGLAVIISSVSTTVIKR